MTFLAETLWDLLRIRPKRGRAPSADDAKTQAVTAPSPRSGSPKSAAQVVATRARPGTMQARYDALVVEMKQRYQVRVRKWRTSSSGCAWEVHYHSGGVSRLIEAPYPRGPMSCAIFLHEIGHHAIGFGAWKPRCLEELKAWQWSLDTMRGHGFNVTPAVEKRMRLSMQYAVAKAMRRGIRSLPEELTQYVSRVGGPRRARAAS